jgi:hypothetical protein
MHLRLGQYQRDVLKWRFFFSGSGTRFGIYLRDGKLIERRVPPPAMHAIDTSISYGLRTFNVPLINHPIRKPSSCDPPPPWEDREVAIHDVSTGKWFLLSCAIRSELPSLSIHRHDCESCHYPT